MQKSSSQKSEIVFTIADERNLDYAKGLEASFKKFHPDKEFRIYGPEQLKEIRHHEIPDFFYKATPFIAKDLIREYDLVVKIDADSVVTYELDNIFNDSSNDFAAVLNNNSSQHYSRYLP